MIRVLIADDEPAARVRLRRLLAAHADIAAIHETGDGPAALAVLATQGPVDLAMLDIEMPGASGLQLAAQLPPGCCCVFSTAYEQHALRAFELGAVDYLLKPYGAERLAATLQRVRALLALPPPRARLQAPAGERFVETRGGRQRIQLAEVQWLSSADNYVALHLPPATHLERSTLTDFLAQDGCAGLFVRVHRSHAVNPAHVMGIEFLSDGEALLTLRCGQQLRVSRGYRRALDALR